MVDIVITNQKCNQWYSRQPIKDKCAEWPLRILIGLILFVRHCPLSRVSPTLTGHATWKTTCIHSNYSPITTRETRQVKHSLYWCIVFPETFILIVLMNAFLFCFAVQSVLATGNIWSVSVSKLYYHDVRSRIVTMVCTYGNIKDTRTVLASLVICTKLFR